MSRGRLGMENVGIFPLPCEDSKPSAKEYISNHNHETVSVRAARKVDASIQTDKHVFWAMRHVRTCRHVKLMPDINTIK